MTGKWIYAGAIALMALCTEQAAAQQEIVLHHDVNGKEMKATLRKALPVEAPRVRYPGFKQETLVLKKGSIRREGTRLHIPADTRSAFPVISVHSPVSIQCRWQS